jgi:predicted amidohydrolase
MHYRLTHPLRSHCGIPAAWVDERVSDERIVELAARAPDRTLYVLASQRDSLADRPVGEVFTVLEHRSVRLEQTLTAPPRDLVDYGLDVLAAPVRPRDTTQAG